MRFLSSSHKLHIQFVCFLLIMSFGIINPTSLWADENQECVDACKATMNAAMEGPNNTLLAANATAETTYQNAVNAAAAVRETALTACAAGSGSPTTANICNTIYNDTAALAWGTYCTAIVTMTLAATISAVTSCTLTAAAFTFGAAIAFGICLAIRMTLLAVGIAAVRAIYNSVMATLAANLKACLAGVATVQACVDAANATFDAAELATNTSRQNSMDTATQAFVDASASILDAYDTCRETCVFTPA